MAGPRPVARSRHAHGLSGPSNFRAPRGAYAKPKGSPQDSTDSSVPATAGMPRSGFRENRHIVGVARPDVRIFRLAQGGNCDGPLIRRRRTFIASGTTVRGMNPGQATKPGSFSKTAGPASPREPTRAWPARSTRQGPQPGQAPRLGKVHRPGRSSWHKATQPGATMASLASQSTRGIHGNPATGQLPSHLRHTMGRDLNH